MKDNLLRRVKALPAANANNLTDVIDFGVESPFGGVQAPLRIEIAVPALPNLVNTKQAVFQVMDCDTEGGTYAEVETTGNMKVTGPSSGGSSAKTWKLYVPPLIRRYVKVKCSVDASGGDNTASSYTVDFCA
jgi:hypothetical protein